MSKFARTFAVVGIATLSATGLAACSTAMSEEDKSQLQASVERAEQAARSAEDSAVRAEAAAERAEGAAARADRAFESSVRK